MERIGDRGSAWLPGWRSSWGTCKISSLSPRFCSSLCFFCFSFTFFFSFSFSFSFSFAFSFFSLFWVSLSFFNTSNAVSAFFLASSARAAFRSEVASSLQLVLSSSACSSGAQRPFSSVQADPFSSFPVLPCASEPGEHLPACASSPPLVVPVSTFPCPSLSAQPVVYGLRYAARSHLQPVIGFHITKVRRQPQHVSVSFVEDHPATFQTAIAYNENRIQDTTTDYNTSSSSNQSEQPLLQHFQ